tara:strand:- start:1907 stop:2104 length:198 start_codon:yes stop_codon:yes gene_type:complete
VSKRRFNNFENRFVDALDRRMNNPIEYTDRMKQEEDEFYAELDKYYHLQDLRLAKEKDDTKVYSV